jgi:tRNA A-37 threonylcarbamoyl transferase component Bud32
MDAITPNRRAGHLIAGSDEAATTVRGSPATPTSGLPLSRVSEDFGLGTTGLPSATADPLIGADCGGVRVERLIAEGGMGRVYEGIQVALRRRVAVKFPRVDGWRRVDERRFRREAAVLATLEHPGIPRILGTGVHQVEGGPPRPCIVMELVADARPITAWCREQGLSHEARIELLLAVSEAMAHAHDRGVVHRDLKPANVLIDAAGKPRIVDFGVAAWSGSAAVTTSVDGRVVGTPAYMSPEQREGMPADSRCDIFALGVLAAELLTDAPPARAQVLLAERSDPLARIVHRCLEIDSARRYPSARDLAAALSEQVGSEGRCGLPVTKCRVGGGFRMLRWVLIAELVIMAVLVWCNRPASGISRPIHQAAAVDAGFESSPAGKAR